jgi:Ca2+-binding RTX toxin-like protein
MPNKTFTKISKSRTLRVSLGTLLLAFAAGCSSSSGPTSPTGSPAPVSGSKDPIEAILGQALSQPHTQCTFNATSGAMTVAVAGETAIISKRATDSHIVQNGYDCDVPVLASKLKTISITGTTADETVILDYTNGLFATGAAGAPGVPSVDMGNTSPGADLFGIRGTSVADTVTFGLEGISINSDKNKDITFKGEPDSYAVSLAAGDDKWSASGGAAVGLTTAYNGGKPIAIYGGAGKDTFEEGAVSTPKESIHGGEDSDTLNYASRDVAKPVKITMGAAVQGADAGAPAATNDDGEYDFTGGASVEADDIDVDVEVITGTPGNDDIANLGGTTAVTLNGGAGNDKLAGGAGDDTLNGGDGDDTFLEGSAANGADTFNGGAGVDTVDYSARTLGVTVTMDGTKANDGDTAGNEKDNVKADVENCYGGSAADSITGNTSNNTLRGGLGADTLTGGDGDDTFDEGGSDRTSTDVDNDSIVCGKGVDTVTYAGRSNALSISISGTAVSGDPLLGASSGDAGGGGGDGGVSLAGEMDTINLDCENATGGSGVNTMTGSSGPNELTGGASADVIDGKEGDDTIDGGGGADTIIGGAGGGDICFDTSGTKATCEL